MLTNKAPNPKALKILMRYDPLAERAGEGGDTAARDEEFGQMVSAGLAFPKMALSHDEAVQACFEAYRPGDRGKFTNLFAAGLGASRPDWRSGLGAFALMQTMPRHSFQPNRAGVCEICAGHASAASLDLTFLNQIRYAVGGFVLAMRPYEIQFFLRQQNMLDDIEPTASDRHLLDSILEVARNAGPSTTPLALQKLLKNSGGPKLTNDQWRSLIETLGLCGILQTAEHPGYLDHFTNPGLAPHKTRSSDWAYPVDFWTGADGVNEAAVDFWFGNLLKN